jgi:hypothetical protein
MPFPKVKGHELASCFNCEAELVVRSGCFPMTVQEPITLQDAKSIARHLGSLYARCGLATIA